VWSGATPVALKCLKDKDHMKEFLAEVHNDNGLNNVEDTNIVFERKRP